MVEKQSDWRKDIEKIWGITPRKNRVIEQTWWEKFVDWKGWWVVLGIENTILELLCRRVMMSKRKRTPGWLKKVRSITAKLDGDCKWIK